MYTALIDTGASLTCISPRVVRDLSLQGMGKIRVAGVGGAVPRNRYLFAVGIQAGQFYTWPIFGLGFNNAGGSYDVLLGRDVLCQGVLLMIPFAGQAIFCW